MHGRACSHVDVLAELVWRLLSRLRCIGTATAAALQLFRRCRVTQPVLCFGARLCFRLLVKSPHLPAFHLTTNANIGSEIACFLCSTQQLAGCPVTHGMECLSHGG